METNVINNGCKDRFTKKYYMYPILFIVLHTVPFCISISSTCIYPDYSRMVSPLQLRFKQHANSITKEQKKYSATEDSSPV